MGYMIEITENKLDEMSECLGHVLRYGGKLMDCIEDMKHEAKERMGERGGDDMDYRERSYMDNRRGGGRMGNREDGRVGWQQERYADRMFGDYAERGGSVPGTGRSYR